MAHTGKGVGTSSPCSPDGVMALSIEVIAKPQAARHAHRVISEEVTSALQGIAGFAGCMVMVSDREWRLLTVITFWKGEDRARYCNKSTPWIQKLLLPHVDHCLRVGTLNAYLPQGLAVFGATEEQYQARRFAQPAEELSLCVA
jgi:hypothetical protein